MPTINTFGSARGFGWLGAGKPNQVTGLTATDFGTSRAYNNGRIDLSWSVPANNGAAITGYKIERSLDNSGWTTIAASNAGTTYSDTGLSSNQIYYYRVSAINAVGTGPLSASASATATTVPQAPTIGTLSRTNDSTASLTFTAGANGGKTITSYTGTSSPGSFTGSGGSPMTISASYVRGQGYTFTVTATNANGTSTASNSSNSVVINTSVLVNYLVVAGGGGGGAGPQSASGGGGAGGVRGSYDVTGGGASLESGLSITKSTNYTVTVGAGAAAVASDNNANSGNNSVFSTITSTGGGAGGAYLKTNAGATGGSGGGSGTNGGVVNGGAGTTGQGYAGGPGRTDNASYRSAGGGGGAGQVGGDAGNTNSGGNGGNGVTSSISGSSVSYGGGGGGTNNTASTGGTGGGGAGVATGNGVSGTANTGGGGGGNSSGNSGGGGGSGVVILRWTTSQGTISIGAGLTYTTTTSGSDSIARFTAGTGNVSWS